MLTPSVQGVFAGPGLSDGWLLLVEEGISQVVLEAQAPAPLFQVRVPQ